MPCGVLGVWAESWEGPGVGILGGVMGLGGPGAFLGRPGGSGGVLRALGGLLVRPGWGSGGILGGPGAVLGPLVFEYAKSHYTFRMRRCLDFGSIQSGRRMRYILSQNGSGDTP